MSTVLPYINQSFIVLSAISMGIGWYFIRKQKVETHRRFMLFGTILAVLFFLSYLAKTAIVGDTTFGGPHSLRFAYQTFLQAHSILATVAAVLGIITLNAAFKQKFPRHRKIGPWTVSVWFITAVTGVTVFLMLYVLYPSGPTTNLFKAWLGS